MYNYMISENPHHNPNDAILVAALDLQRPTMPLQLIIAMKLLKLIISIFLHSFIYFISISFSIFINHLWEMKQWHFSLFSLEFCSCFYFFMGTRIMCARMHTYNTQLCVRAIFKFIICTSREGNIRSTLILYGVILWFILNLII